MILPAYNEEDTLARAVGDIDRGLRARGTPFEIVVIENGSTDGTRRVLVELGATVGPVRAIELPDADYGAALRAGILSARGEVWAIFNVDYYDLHFLDAALARLPGGPGGHGAAAGAAPGADLVLATKRGHGAHDGRGWFRRVATGTFTRLTHLLLGIRAADTHGMKVGAAAALRPVVDACTFTADLFDTELVARAERAGMHVVEIPVTVTETRPARTSLARRVPRTLVGLVRLRRTLDRERSGDKVRLT